MNSVFQVGFFITMTCDVLLAKEALRLRTVNHLGAVFTDNLVGVANEQTEDQANTHHNDESGVSTDLSQHWQRRMQVGRFLPIGDRASQLVDVLTERNLRHC